MKKLSVLASACLLSVTLTSTAQAMTLDFDFSFTDGVDTILGTIFGLTDNVTSAATSVSASGPGLRSELHEFIPVTSIGTINTFTVQNGELTDYSFFQSYTTFQGDFVILSLHSVFPRNNFAQLFTTGASFSTIATDDVPNITLRTPPVSAVPIPPAGILFGSGLVVLAAMRRRANKQAQA